MLSPREIRLQWERQAADNAEMTIRIRDLEDRVERLRASGAFYERFMFDFYGWDQRLRVA